MMDTIEKSLDMIYSAPPAGTEALERLQQSVQEWQDAIWYDALRDSPVGPLFVAVGNQGLVAVGFGTDEAGFVRELEARHGVTTLRSMERVSEAMSQILQYLSGDRRSFGSRSGGAARLCSHLWRNCSPHRKAKIIACGRASPCSESNSYRSSLSSSGGGRRINDWIFRCGWD
jgi:hypothetical protein